MSAGKKGRREVRFGLVDEFSTNKYRVTIEFFGIDAKYSEKNVAKFAEWNLADNGAVVTSLSLRKIPHTSARYRAYEWSIAAGAASREFRNDPQAFMRKALTENLGIEAKSIRMPIAPKGRRSGTRTHKLRGTEQRIGLTGKCKVINEASGGQREVECTTDTYKKSSGWGCN